MSGVTHEHVPALIVGGGPVGLTASVMLSRAGVPSLLIERHSGTAIHPKSRGVNARTMEILDQLGLGEAARRTGLDAAENGFFFRGPSLVSERYTRFGGGGRADDVRAMSPCTWLVIAQDVLEPVLLGGARASDLATLRFGQELVGIEPRADGVEARFRDRISGDERRVLASYVVGADGAESSVRQALAIDMEGHGPLRRNVSILFRADLEAEVADRRSAVYYITDDDGVRPGGHPMSVGNPPPAGVLLTVNNADRWLLVVAEETTGGASIEDPRDERWSALVRRAAGRPDLAVEVLSLMPWSPAARVATRYRDDRVFLAGDAAHEMTPSGAFGLNVGIQDAHNLGWKLGAVLAGWAGPGLLESYEAERRPAGSVASDESYRQFAGTSKATPFGNWGLIFGGRYRSEAILPDDEARPDDPVDDGEAVTVYRPSAAPGGRSPHAWLRRRGERLSTLSLFGPGFCVLGGSASRPWLAAARQLAVAASLPLSAVGLGDDIEAEDPDAFHELYGIEPGGAVLVRPDGHVAWRARAMDPAPDQRLADVLRRLLDRSVEPQR